MELEALKWQFVSQLTAPRSSNTVSIFFNWGIGETGVWKFPDFVASDGASNSKQPHTHLLFDEAITHWAFLTLVRSQVVEVVHLTFVTLIANKALATVTGTITVTLHGNGAHRVTVTGCGSGWGGGAGWWDGSRRKQEKSRL